jgi:hypothetical protein
VVAAANKKLQNVGVARAGFRKLVWIERVCSGKRAASPRQQLRGAVVAAAKKQWVGSAVLKEEECERECAISLEGEGIIKSNAHAQCVQPLDKALAATGMATCVGKNNGYLQEYRFAYGATQQSSSQSLSTKRLLHNRTDLWTTTGMP